MARLKRFCLCIALNQLTQEMVVVSCTDGPVEAARRRARKRADEQGLADAETNAFDMLSADGPRQLHQWLLSLGVPKAEAANLMRAMLALIGGKADAGGGE